MGEGRLVSWGMVLPDGMPSVDDLLVHHNTLVTSQGGEAAEEPTLAMLEAWVVEHPKHPDVLRSIVSAKLQASGDTVTEELVPWLERYAEARPPDPMPHKLLAKYYLDGKGTGKDAAIPHLRFLNRASSTRRRTRWSWLVCCWPRAKGKRREQWRRARSRCRLLTRACASLRRPCHCGARTWSKAREAPAGIDRART